jgi:hypothetical protein
MNTILRKIVESFRSRMPDQSAMKQMTEMQQMMEMNQMAEMEPREHTSNDIAAMCGDMEVVPLQPVERQAVMGEDMHAAMAAPESMMAETEHSAGGSGMTTQDQSMDSKA